LSGARTNCTPFPAHLQALDDAPQRLHEGQRKLSVIGVQRGLEILHALLALGQIDDELRQRLLGDAQVVLQLCEQANAWSEVAVSSNEGRQREGRGGEVEGSGAGGKGECTDSALLVSSDLLQG